MASEGDDYEQDDPVDEAPAGRELAEEAHLYAQFTCTHKIRDFVKEQNSGVPHPFPMIEMIKGAPYGSVDHHFLMAEHKKRMFAISYDDGEPRFAEDR